MRKNKKANEDDEECQKQQEIQQNAPRRKRIQKRTIATRSSTKGQIKNKEEQQMNVDLETYPIQFIQHQENNHICPICLDFIVKAVTTLCGHSFCEYCLNEYVLFFQDCLQCGQILRNQRFSYNRALDNLVENIVGPLGEETKKEFVHRWEENSHYSDKKKVTSLDIGDEIDVRDKNFVWCRARICKAICRVRENRTKYIFVSYIGKPKSYNQEISQFSERLAAPGFYSSRDDILHYQVNQNGDLKLKSPLVFRNNEEMIMIEQENFQ